MMISEKNPATFSDPVFEVTTTTTISDRSKQDGPSWDDQRQPYIDLAYLIRDVRDPALVISGIFGNCLILLVMRRLPSFTYSVFFNTLALSDQLVLIAGPLDRLFYSKLKFTSISDGSTWQCKFYRLTYRTVTVLSAWMLVSLTMLRAASVLWPLRVSAVWTKGKSRATAGIVIIFIIGINFYLLKKYGVKRGICRLTGSGLYLFWIRLFQINFLPVILLVITNSVLCWTLIRSVNTRQLVPVQQGIQQFREQKVSSLSVTVIVASVCFVLLTTPFAICIMTYEYGYFDRDHPIQSGQYSVFNVVSYALLYSNSAAKFYLYCVTFTKFIAELRHVLQECYGLCHEETQCSS